MPGPRSVILRGLPLCGQVADFPSCFHFVIIPLTDDRGIFGSKEISQMDLLHSLSQMFVEAVC
ncbi:unnamed protein product, partial [Staurois parvus]